MSIKLKNLPTSVWVNRDACWSYDPQGKDYMEYIREDIVEGMLLTEHEANMRLKKAMSSLWKDAQGDELPEIDREVIALVGLEGFFEMPPDEPVKLSYKVVFAHRPPEYWDGKNILTGKVTRNYTMRYDKGGWNIPDVKFWLDYNMDSIFKRNNENNKIDKR